MFKDLLINRRNFISIFFLIAAFLIVGKYIFNYQPREVKLKIWCKTIRCDGNTRLNISFYQKGELIRELTLRLKEKEEFNTSLSPGFYTVVIKAYTELGIYRFEKKLNINKELNPVVSIKL